MEQLHIDALYVNMLEEISWLLNMKATGQHEFDPLFNSALLLVKSKDGNVPKLHMFLEENMID